MFDLPVGKSHLRFRPVLGLVVREPKRSARCWVWQDIAYSIEMVLGRRIQKNCPSPSYRSWMLTKRALGQSASVTKRSAWRRAAPSILSRCNAATFFGISAAIRPNRRSAFTAQTEQSQNSSRARSCDKRNDPRTALRLRRCAGPRAHDVITALHGRLAEGPPWKAICLAGVPRPLPQGQRI